MAPSNGHRCEEFPHRCEEFPAGMAPSVEFPATRESSRGPVVRDTPPPYRGFLPFVEVGATDMRALPAGAGARRTGPLRGFSASLRFFRAAMAPSNGHRCEEFPAAMAPNEGNSTLHRCSQHGARCDDSRVAARFLRI